MATSAFSDISRKTASSGWRSGGLISRACRSTTVFFVEAGDWMKPVESQLAKLDEAVRLGKKHGIHVQRGYPLL